MNMSKQYKYIYYINKYKNWNDAVYLIIQIISWNASTIVTQEKTFQSWISHISNYLYNRFYKKA